MFSQRLSFGLNGGELLYQPQYQSQSHQAQPSGFGFGSASRTGGTTGGSSDAGPNTDNINHGTADPRLFASAATLASAGPSRGAGAASAGRDSGLPLFAPPTLAFASSQPTPGSASTSASAPSSSFTPFPPLPTLASSSSTSPSSRAIRATPASRPSTGISSDNRNPAMWAEPHEATLAQSTPVLGTAPIPLDAAPLQEVLRARHERWSRHNGAMELPMATFAGMGQGPFVPPGQLGSGQNQAFGQSQGQALGSGQGQGQGQGVESGRPFYNQQQIHSQQLAPQNPPLRTQSFGDHPSSSPIFPSQQGQLPFQPQAQAQAQIPGQGQAQGHRHQPQQASGQAQGRGRSTSINTYDPSLGPTQEQSSSGYLRPHRTASTSRRSPGADDITTDRSPAISVSQMSEVELLVAMSRTTLMSGYFTRPIDPPQWMRVLFPVEDDLQCFHHCIVYSMSIFVVKEDRNPWIEHVVPLILFPTEFAPQSTQAMRLAMLATGATHLAYLEARKAAGSPEAQRKRRLALRYRSESVRLMREARHSPSELTSDAFLAATAIMLSNDMLAANSTWREIARLSRFAIHARGGCETMIKGMAVKNSGQLAVLCVLSQLLVLDLYAVLSTGEMPHLYHGEEWWFQNDSEAPSMFDAILGMSETTVVLAAQALIIWQDSFLLQARFGEEETSRLAFPPESHFVVTQPTPGALDFRITLPRHAPNVSRTYAVPGAPRELEDLARRTRQFLERNEQWHTSDWTNTLEERTQWGSLALYIGQHIMLRRDMYRLPREDEGCQILADVLLRMCLTVGDKMQFFKWPLIIAASVFTDEARREATRQTLKAFEYQCCYEIAVAQAVIEESWRRADEGMDDDTCHWKRCFLELGCSVLLY